MVRVVFPTRRQGLSLEAHGNAHGGKAFGQGEIGQQRRFFFVEAFVKQLSYFSLGDPLAFQGVKQFVAQAVPQGVGDAVELTIIRDGQEQRLQVQLDKRPDG